MDVWICMTVDLFSRLEEEYFDLQGQVDMGGRKMVLRHCTQVVARRNKVEEGGRRT
jgi:hypothetical protein